MHSKTFVRIAESAIREELSHPVGIDENEERLLMIPRALLLGLPQATGGSFLSSQLLRLWARLLLRISSKVSLLSGSPPAQHRRNSSA